MLSFFTEMGEGVSLTFCPGWLPTSVLLISTSCIPSITGVIHHAQIQYLLDKLGFGVSLSIFSFHQEKAPSLSSAFQCHIQGHRQHPDWKPGFLDCLPLSSSCSFQFLCHLAPRWWGRAVPKLQIKADVRGEGLW